MVSHTASLLLVTASAVRAAEEGGLTYTPNQDVTSHSKIALDQLDIKGLIDSGDFDGAKEIYINGKNREGKSLQQMARVDWAAQGVDDLSDYEAYATLFRPGNGEPYLDSFNLDAMNCTGSFEGQTIDMCAISAKKNLLCTGLNYAQYEGVKAIQYENEKNWDELFAFWNGVYDESVDTRVNSGGPGAVQESRDSDFGTSFREASIQAIIDGQKAFSGSFNKAKLEKAYEDFNRANLATFAQATLKYAGIFDEAGLEKAKMDKKWGEGYAYFRCGAGLMDPELALYIDYVLDPRDKLGVEFTPKETLCKIVDKMLSLPEIGMGVQMDDLNVETYLPTIKEDCGIDSFKHAAGAKKSENVRAYIPILGMLVVASIYVFGFVKFGRGTKED
mmetsp:Transcript_24551/g.30858  ORF Transcript_24551/g.30858 Transcript_24551/m.30858 type:complete len:389 (-) Transcript_24551:52-1218(-)